MLVYKALYAGIAPCWFTPVDHHGREFNLVEPRGILGWLLLWPTSIIFDIFLFIACTINPDLQAGFPIWIRDDGTETTPPEQ